VREEWVRRGKLGTQRQVIARSNPQLNCRGKKGSGTIEAAVLIHAWENQYSFAVGERRKRKGFVKAQNSEEEVREVSDKKRTIAKISTRAVLIGDGDEMVVRRGPA